MSTKQYETEILVPPHEKVGDRVKDGQLLGDTPKIECPYCEEEGRTAHEYNLCGQCGCWFVVKEREA